MRIVLCFALLLSLAITGCTVAGNAPVSGLIVVEEKGPVAGFDNFGDGQGWPKRGEAVAEGILVVGYGDASIQAAMKEGNITKVHHVDCEVTSILGVYAKYKTIVYGE